MNLQSTIGLLTSIAGLVIAFWNSVSSLNGTQDLSAYSIAAYMLISGIVAIVGGPMWLRAILVDVEKLLRNIKPEPKSSVPPTIPPLAILLVALLASSNQACAGRFEVAKLGNVTSPEPDKYHCSGLDNDRSLFSALAKGLAAASGAQGLSVIPVDDNTGRAVLAGGVVLTAAGAIILQTIADNKSISWVRDCSQ
jgi:hypothetical protein